ncbi:hypothetical protein EHS39_29565 [Ensifer sp. MPMI2T]|nr:hypothetical protein EHS39_29565 [Ensifer sp. MPMI2T]
MSKAHGHRQPLPLTRSANSCLPQSRKEVSIDLENMMSDKPDSEEKPSDLVHHYRPLALKAVRAALSVKAQAARPPLKEDKPMPAANLPWGFHLPIDD